MKDELGRVCGIRLRSTGGHKYAVPGSHNGLFIPSGLSELGHLFVCEGPTDTAALLDLGVDAIGRADCNYGRHQLPDLCSARDVVIVADQGDAGQRGAAKLVRPLLPHVMSVRVLTPPASDARAWINGGATRIDLLKTVFKTPVEGFGRRRFLFPTISDGGIR